jgi:outer membrane lipase/esterase
MIKIATAVLVSGFLATAASATTLTDSFSSFWVFGDSLSDDGNLPVSAAPPAPYFNGRFSNGPVWNEGIQQEFLGAFRPAENFAFGGARTSGPNASGPIPGLDDQVAGFIAAGLPAISGPESVATIWAGANNIFQALAVGGKANRVGRNAAKDVIQSIVALETAGLSNFLVFNLPDIGKSPAYFGLSAATDASDVFNDTLMRNLNKLARNGTSIRIVDINTIFDGIIADPTGSGYVDASTPCILVPGCTQNSPFLFWDSVHPTAVGHQQIEAEARASLAGAALAPAPVPLPAGLPLLLAGIGAFAVLRKRRVPQ